MVRRALGAFEKYYDAMAVASTVAGGTTGAGVGWYCARHDPTATASDVPVYVCAGALAGARATFAIVTAAPLFALPAAFGCLGCHLYEYYDAI
jgi:hypothetical protein